MYRHCTPKCLSHCSFNHCVWGDIDRMHYHSFQLRKGCKIYKKTQSLPPGNLSLSRGVRQKQITPVQRGTHSMLCLVQEGGVWERKTSWRKWLLSRFMKEEQDWKGRGFGRHLKPTKCPIQRWEGRARTCVDGRVGLVGWKASWISGKASWALLGRQGELVKGSEKIINLVP